jgi:branched-chain amino acid transport system permease protein
LPIATSLGLLVLLRALAALMLGRMTNLPAIVLAAIALGVLENAVVFTADSAATAPAVLAVVIIATLLLQRRAVVRAERQESSTWQAAEEVRPVPPEMRRVREVQVVRYLVGALVVGGVLLLPNLLNTEDSLKASAVGIYAIIGISIIVLTGWAGQISLGQMAFVAWGSAVTAKLTVEWNVDFLLALPAATVAGALVAVVVGLPALRLRGLYLAVTTLAFSVVTIDYLLNDEFFGWVEDGRFDRLPLLGRIDLETPTRMYYVVFAGLVVVLVALRGIRRSRTGRVVVALRENEAAAQAFGVSPTRAKLTAFAISGAVAAFAGGLLAYHQNAFDPVSYTPFSSIAVFTVAVVGGLGTLLGGVLGALYFLGGRWFLPGDWAILASGLGVLVVLLVLPSGLGGLVFDLRDGWLRWVARRHGVHSPSLVADSMPEPTPGEPALEPAAETAARDAVPTAGGGT